MSNHLAVAAVSAAIGRLLQDALDRDVPGAMVSHDRPGGPGDAARRGVTLFLFQATPNAALRNLDLPLRDSGARRQSRAGAALDLHYLVSVFGSAGSFEPERILGSVVRRLHEHAVLGRDLIRAATEDMANAPAIGEADLATAPEMVKLTPTPLNLEELSKLWSILFQTPYRLSVAYRATTVVIEAEDEVAPAPPVRLRGGFVLPLSAIAVERVAAADDPGAPIVWGGRIALAGRGFRIPGATLRIGGRDVPMDAATETTAEAALTPAAFGGTVLPAGVQAASLRLPPPPGAPAHLARESAAAPFLLRPVLTLPPGAVAAGPPDGEGRHDGTIAVDLVPPLHEGQTARLLLDRTAPRPAVAAVLAPEFPPGAVFPLTRVVFRFAGLPAGTYLARPQVDGAEGPLTTVTDPDDPAFGTVNGPSVVIP